VLVIDRRRWRARADQNPIYQNPMML
jgi:hypothetical protein